MKKQAGAAFLIVTVFLMVATLLTMIYFSRFSNLQQKTAANQYINTKVFEAAEAGLEYGLAYFQTNDQTVLAGPSGGYINYSLSPVSLANGTSYTVTYTNPTANNYKLIKISSTATSTDGTSTRTVSQLVYLQSLVANLPVNTITATGPVDIFGSSNIINKQGPVTITTGSTVDISGSGTTTTLTGGSKRNQIGADIVQNSSTLQNMSPSQLFYNYFGVSETSLMSMVDHYYPNGTTPSLNGMSGTSIWVDGDLSLQGNDQIGTATNPVLLIVNGNLALRGGVTVYGMVYTIGGSDTVNVTDLGNSEIIGGLVTSAASVNFGGNSSLTFDSSVLNAVKTQNTFAAKVPGSWKDY